MARQFEQSRNQIERHHRPALAPGKQTLGVVDHQRHSDERAVERVLVVEHVMLAQQLAVVGRQDHHGVVELTQGF